MNNFKKILAATTTAALMLTGAVFAETAENDIMLITQYLDAQDSAPAAAITTNVEIIDDVVMLPLRSVAEHFGYTVEWNGEDRSIAVSKGAVYTTFAIDENAYSFSKMAPIALEKCPTLVNDETTYVPASFFTEILNLNARKTEEGYKVAQPHTVSVISVEGSDILVNDDYFGEVLVHTSEETKIYANGEAVAFEVIEKDQLLAIEYNDIMTMSIPAQTTAVEIEVLNLPVEEDSDNIADLEDMPAPTASVKVISVNEEGSITVEDEVHGEVIVWIADETVITKNGETVSADEITADMALTIEYSDAMTMSIPPQTTAVSIVIE